MKLVGWDNEATMRKPIVRRMAAGCSIGLLLLVACAGASLAWAEDPPSPSKEVVLLAEDPRPSNELDEQESSLPELAVSQLTDIQEAPVTNPDAAAQMPHRDLERDEALDLLQGVFGQLLQMPAGPFDDLEIERFLSDNTAVISSDSLTSTGIQIGPTSQNVSPQQSRPALLESLLPLRIENPDGEKAPVDLSLESIAGKLQVANGLIPLDIPERLNEGIGLPQDVRIYLMDAPPNREPSTINTGVAVYPNTATDTDFVIAPTPTGIETFAQIRSPDAPMTHTLQFDLPPDGVLKATKDGGAQALRGEEGPILSILPPTATDAAGRGVPVDLAVTGSASVTLTVTPSQTTSWPVLVDPIIETYAWYTANNRKGIYGTTNHEEWSPINIGGLFSIKDNVAALSPPSPLKYELPGLYVQNSGTGTLKPGYEGTWIYHVPRYYSDYSQYKVRPTTFIEGMTLQHLGYFSYTTQRSPILNAGLWSDTQNWISLLSIGANEAQFQGGAANLDFSHTYNFSNPGNNPSTKAARFGLVSTETVPSVYRAAYVGDATISLGDSDYPSGALSSPDKWIHNQSNAAIAYSFDDPGLGIYSVTVADRQTPQHTWATSAKCVGGASSPCPHTLSSSSTKLSYDPLVLPQGPNTLDVKVVDPLGHASTAAISVNIDHTAPSLALSGSMTNQASLGTTRPRYILKAAASDGTESSSQSGVVSMSIKVDGKTVDSVAPGCSTMNCAISREWILDSSGYPVGHHIVEVTTVDGVGLVTIKTLDIEIARDTVAPALESWGSLIDAKAGWVDQNTYQLNTWATDPQGYGVTSLSLVIDGKPVKAVTKSCPDGSCQAYFLFPPATVDMAKYSAGAHSAEIVATDGAGNATKRLWTINVNPPCTASSTAALNTLAALAPETVKPTLGGEIGEQIVQPTLTPAAAESLELSGAIANGTLEASVTDGITLEGIAPEATETPEVEIAVEPTAVGPAATSVTNADGAVAIYANTQDCTDLAVRPLPYGVETIQVIRRPSSPDEYTWSVDTPEASELELTDDGGVQLITTAPVVDPVTEETVADGKVLATMSVPQASDATGALVPVSVSLTANEVTLAVAASAGATYPIAVAPAWTVTEAAMNPSAATEDTGEGTNFLSSPPPDGFACHIKAYRPANGGQPYHIYGEARNVCAPGVGITDQDTNGCLLVHVDEKGGGGHWVAVDCRNVHTNFANDQSVYPRAKCHRTDAWRTQVSGYALLKGILYGAGPKFSAHQLLQCRP